MLATRKAPGCLKQQPVLLQLFSDLWDGLNDLFTFESDIQVARRASDTLRYLKDLSEKERKRIRQKARERVLRIQNAANRAQETELYAFEVLNQYSATLQA